MKKFRAKHRINGTLTRYSKNERGEGNAVQSIPKPPRANRESRTRETREQCAESIRPRKTDSPSKIFTANSKAAARSSQLLRSRQNSGRNCVRIITPSPLVQGANRSTASAGFPSLMGRDGRDYTRGRREISTLARVYALPLTEKRKARVIGRGEEEGIDESAIPDI